MARKCQSSPDSLTKKEFAFSVVGSKVMALSDREIDSIYEKYGPKTEKIIKHLYGTHLKFPVNFP